MTHNLGHLLNLPGLNIPADIRTAALTVNPHYAISRYPDAAGGRPADAYDEALANSIMNATKKVRAWLVQHLK